MTNNIKVLMIAAELTPLAKVGGLGDVVGALPKALKKSGVDIRLCLPFYGSIDAKKYAIKKITDFFVYVGGRAEPASLWQTFLPSTNILVYLIKNRHFDGAEIYCGLGPMKNSRYIDNADDLERFAFFSHAVLAAMNKINFAPDIIHANDWHTGIISHLLKAPANKNFFNNTKTVYTIHNLANQGIADKKIFKYLDIDAPTIKADLKNGDVNFMVQGIIGADAITTVSPTYAKEMLTLEYGAGLQKILRKNKHKLYGILNGIDTDFFNPATDELIFQNFSQKNPDKKNLNKLALQKKLGFTQDDGIPLVGFVSRFVWQKGADLIVDRYKDLNCQFAFLGTGEKKYEDQLKKLAVKFPDRFNVQIKFDEQSAHEIYAGSDMFLVPSRFEPCGLTQMIAMRYGSVPIVRLTGGLADTVNNKVGFTFKTFHISSLYKTIKKAIKTFHNKSEFKKIQISGMKTDFSWDKPAKEYLSLYKKIISG